MYNGGATEFLVEQGLYYPTTPINYGYYCTGSDSPGEWDDHQRFFGLDGLDVQHMGVQTENLPYVYYTPSYGYTESPYNPYNPYIPGAMIGVDVPFVGPQHYYTIPPYQTTVSSPAYFPVIAHSRADTIPASSQALLLDTGASSTNTAFSSNIKHNLSSPSPILYMTPQGPSTNQARSFTNVSDVARANVGPSKQAVMHGSISSSGFRNPDSVHSFQRRGASVPNQSLGNISNVKVLSNSSQLKVALPFSCVLSDFSSSAHQRAPADKVQSNFHYGTTLNGVNGNLDALNQQNHGPRTNRLKKLLAVKSYTTKVGDGNAEGNIIIYTDQYNKDDFSVNYMDAKFFVIKSYSEDDVHKSVKYNLWSSTPNGNKKLNRIYEDAQRMQAAQSRPCPVFLFFSVNASGQFCGVAEMIGPVDFQKDMDFWQQDKWSGSFPVKWHIIKDVPNTNFRHILLENNEYKPVTSSRDTQEIRYKPGLEMLRIFKNYTLKTSLLDDFLYYENRQKFMQEEKARLPVESYGNSFFITPTNPPRKHSSGVDIRPSVEERISQHNKVNLSDKAMVTTSKHVSWTTVPSSTCKDENDEHVAAAGAKDNIVSTLAVGSLSLNPKQDESNPVTTTSGTPLCTQLDDVVTIGSMPVKVNGHSESSRFLRVGTISLDPKALYPDKGGDSVKLDLDT